MKTKILYLVLALLIAIPMSFADENEPEIEIQLFEVVGTGIIGGDNTLLIRFSLQTKI